ncbi:SDR family oxidoreductase [Leucobacter weissii]|uniref:SDR family oxidoreductase n=1 Tax=Leucobacter weissii TaxID=1983706 RepID=A0A939MK63_9MICO|nr:oxidoreductase [Leucobacter weissii]MBO1902478.1 SDR family oxidoreductase [Leucobacter weissii]
MTYEVPNQSGKLAVVTGANSGTGKEAARGLAGAGARVIMAVRTLAKGEEAKRDILATHPDAKVEVRRLDLADLSSVQEFADQLIAEGTPVDLLLNNAGVMMLPKRYETKDGLEMQLGTNFFGHFALTVRLLPLLLKAAAPRVVTMSSSNQAPIDFEDLNWEKSYDANGAYGRSKLADMLLSQQLARIAKDKGWNLLSVGAHPGNSSTNIFDNGAQYGDRPILAIRIAWRITPSHSPAAGAAPMLYAATRSDVTQGGYYGPRFGLIGSPAPARISKRGQDTQTAARLWAEAERLTGVTLTSVGL